MATLKEIAEEAGVSMMMVSRVVNKQYDKVSKKNIRRIEKIIEKHGYVPNLSARNLSTKSSKIIALILRSGKENILDSLHDSSMIGYICSLLQKNEYTSMIYSVKEDYKYISTYMKNWNAAGAIFFGLFDHDMPLIQADNDVPMVFTDSYSNIRQFTNVGVDDYKGAQLAAEHFLSYGHERFLFVGYSTEFLGVVQQRRKGFEDTIHAAGLDFSDANVVLDEEMDDQLEHVFSQENAPTAVFATADELAVKVMKKLESMGISVPMDCSVIGFDNLFFSAYTAPMLTTIGQDIQQKAKAAVDILMRHIEDKSLPHENVTLDVCLVERESVGPPPGR